MVNIVGEYDYCRPLVVSFTLFDTIKNLIQTIFFHSFIYVESLSLIKISSAMAFGRGHASFTIDTLKLAKDSLPAAVTEPPPVFPVSMNF